MKKLLNNEKGLTLVEVLAVFVIGVIVLILLTGVVTSIQKQYKKQSSETGNLFEETYAAKMITKDVRGASSVSISCDEKTLEILRKRDGDKEVKTTYRFDGSKIIKKEDNGGKESNSSIENIEHFRVSLPSGHDKCEGKSDEFLYPIDRQFELEIKGLNIKELKTTITIRKGDNHEDS